MSKFVQVDRSIKGKMSHSSNDVEAKKIDLVLLPILVLFIFALFAAVALAIYIILARLFPALNDLNPDSIGSQVWPYGLQTRHVSIIVFVILTLLLYFIARWRISRNQSMQAIAGCPSCQKQNLIRVRRTSMDHLITLGGIRVARYQCRDCQWNGLRIFNQGTHRRAKDHPTASGAIMTQPPRPKESTASIPAKTTSLPPTEPVGLERSMNAGDKAKILTTLGVNLRSEPRSDAEWVGQLWPETIVILLEEVKPTDGIVWYHVEDGKQSGWVQGACLEPLV